VLDGRQVAALLASGGGLSLATLDLGDATPATRWTHALPALTRPRLVVDAVSGRWRVVEHRVKQQTWIDGSLGQADERRFAMPSPRRGMFAAAGQGGGGILLAPDFAKQRQWPWLGPWLSSLTAGMPAVRMKIWLVDASGDSSRLGAEASSWVGCDDAMLGTRRFLCSAGAPMHASLAWIEDRQGTLAVIPIAHANRGVIVGRQTSADGGVAWHDHDRISWVDGKRSVGIRIAVAQPHAEGRNEIQNRYARPQLALGNRRLAVALSDKQSWQLTVYEAP